MVYYWKHENVIDPVVWNKLIEAALQVLNIAKNEGVSLTGKDPYSDIKPLINGEVIELNGVGDDGCEPLILRRNPVCCEPLRRSPNCTIEGPHHIDIQDGLLRQSCKTRCKSYDIAVGAILYLAEHLSDRQIRVTGGGIREDWEKTEFCTSDY